MTNQSEKDRNLEAARKRVAERCENHGIEKCPECMVGYRVPRTLEQKLGGEVGTLDPMEADGRTCGDCAAWRAECDGNLNGFCEAREGAHLINSPACSVFSHCQADREPIKQLQEELDAERKKVGASDDIIKRLCERIKSLEGDNEFIREERNAREQKIGKLKRAMATNSAFPLALFEKAGSIEQCQSMGGLTKREIFAMMAPREVLDQGDGSIKWAAEKLGVSVKEYSSNPLGFHELVARDAVRWADALAAELERTK